MRLAVLLVSALLLSGCATARLHSEAELDGVAQSCGLGLGELVQEEEAKRLLFVFRIAPTAQQRACIAHWARKNRMRAVIIEAVNEPVA